MKKPPQFSEDSRRTGVAIAGTASARPYWAENETLLLDAVAVLRVAVAEAV